MNAKRTGLFTLKFKKDEIVCSTENTETDLYLIHEGKLLIFGNEGSRITPFATINAGEYFGELSFFDGQPRSANAVCLEDTTLIKIPVEELDHHCPAWLKTFAIKLVSQVRQTTELMNKKGIRRKNVETIKPLSIDEQRHYFQLLEEYNSN
jgi:CRP-like cAMP-binding protein